MILQNRGLNCILHFQCRNKDFLLQILLIFVSDRNGTNEFWTGNIRGGLNFSSNVSAIVSVECFQPLLQNHGSGINSREEILLLEQKLSCNLY